MESYKYPNPQGITLSLWQQERMIWSSKGHWLLPLFELEAFLNTSHLNPKELAVHDTIQGKAAAALCIYLSLGKVAVDLISEGALGLYASHQTDVVFTERTERIQCITETMITDDMEIKDIYSMLRRKAGLTGGMELTLKDTIISGYPVPLTLHLDKGEGIILRYPDKDAEAALRRYFTGEGNQEGVLVTGGLLSGKQTVIKAVSSVKENAELALRRVGCYDVAFKTWEDLQETERQLVWLAVALASKAKLFILDNPLEGLGRDGKQRYLSVLSSLSFSEMPTILMLSNITVPGWKSYGVSG